MAYSAGSIAFSGLPNQYTVITINDGQSAAYSTLKLGVQVSDSSLSSIFVSGAAASNNVMDGNASELVTVYQQGNTTRRPFFDFSLVAGGASFADWKAAFKNDGTAPAKLQFKQPGFGGFTIDFVDLSSGFTATSGLGSFGRDNGTGDYSINLNSIGNLSNTMNTIKSIFAAANTAGEADFYTSQLSVSSNYLRVMDDRATSAANVLSLALVPSGSASWTDAGVVAWKVGTDRGNNNMASVQTANEVVYAARGASGDSSSTLTTAQFATYIGALINNLPIQITATVSDGTVSLTNDVEGTAGNVTITTTDATNITLSGMSGGASSGGDTVAKRLQISARQIALSGSGGLSGSADGKSALMLDLAGLSAAAVAQADSFAFQDASDSKPKSITFSDLEDAVFANISGQAAVAAGGALSLDVSAITAQTEMTGDVADADEFMISDGGVLKRADFSVVRDAVFADVSGDATIAAGGALTIGANAVQTGMVHDDVADELAGDGLSATSGVLAVGVDDSSLELDSDALRVKTGGVTNAMLAGSIVASKMNNAIFEDLETLGAASADGEFIVATAAGEFAYESGNTARTSLGLGTGDSPQFTGLTLSGDLYVQGSTVTMDVANLQVEDTIIGLGISGSTEGAAGDRGLIMHITGETNPAMFWDDDEDEFAFVRTSATGSATTITPDAYADLHVNAMDIDGAMDVAGNSVLNGTLELGGVAAASADVSADSFYFLDGDSLVKSESMANYAAAIAGDGLSAASGILAVDMNELTEAVVAPGSDSFMFIDSDGNVTRKDTIADLATLQAGDGLSASSGSFAVNVDDSGIEISSDSLQLRDLGVTTAKLAADAVTAAKLADDAVVTANIVDANVTTAKIAADAITGAKIADDAVDSEHIAADSIDSEHYAPGSVDTTALGADAVTAAKLNDDIKGDGLQITDGVLSITHSEVRETGTACAASAVLFGSGGAYDELTNAPASAAAVSVYFNGIMQSQGTDYTISGSTITLGSGNSIAAEDEVIVKYINQ